MPINKKKKNQEDIAIILSSPCETSSNGIHLKTRRVIRELIGHMMVEIYDHQCQLTKKKKKKKQEDLAIILSSPCETSSNGIHLKTRRVIRELIGHMMVEIYDHQCQLTKKKKNQEDIAIILSSPCETSSNGIHLKTRRVIRELIGHMMVEIYDHQCQLTKKKKKKKQEDLAIILSSPCETSSNGIHLKTRRVIRELIGHMMVEIYDHQCQLTKKKKKKKQEDLAIILSSPCETSSNGIHLKTRRVIRELIGHMMVEIYDHQCQLTKKKKKETRRPSDNSVFTM